MLQDKFDGRVDKMLQWLDDFLFYANSKKELLDNIESFLRVCKEIRLKVHAEKLTFFSKEVQFCGRIISSEGCSTSGFLEVCKRKHQPTTTVDLASCQVLGVA